MGLSRSYTLEKLGFHTGDSLVTGATALPALKESNESGASGRKFSVAEENVLKLLSDGHSQEVVANTLGIGSSAISQYLAKDWFREELAARKSVKLERYSKIDDGYDRIEGRLLEKMESVLPFMTKPNEIMHALAKVNAAKRRLGDSSKVQNTPVTQIINITLPTSVVHKFSRTHEGHVVAVDEKSLVTITSNSMEVLSNTVLSAEDAKEIQNAQPPKQFALKGRGR